jgi:hypothetical protein
MEARRAGEIAQEEHIELKRTKDKWFALYKEKDQLFTQDDFLINCYYKAVKCS